MCSPQVGSVFKVLSPISTEDLEGTYRENADYANNRTAVE